MKAMFLGRRMGTAHNSHCLHRGFRPSPPLISVLLKINLNSELIESAGEYDAITFIEHPMKELRNVIEKNLTPMNSSLSLCPIS